MAYGTADGFEIEHKGKDYNIKLSDTCKYDQRWMLAKYRFVSDLRDIAGAETISFVEEYAKPEKKEEGKEEKVSKEKEEETKTEKAPEELTDEDRKSA